LPEVPSLAVWKHRAARRVANPGAYDATGLTFHVHEGPMGGSFGGFPSGLRWRTWSGSLGTLPDATEWTAADAVLFRLTRYGGEPGAAIEWSDPAPAMTMYLMESGAVERMISGPGGEFISVWRSGSKGSRPTADDVEQTLTAVGDEPASFLELVAIPRSSASD